MTPALIAAVLAAAPAVAKKPPRESEAPVTADRAAAIAFDELERRLIRDFFGDPREREAVAPKRLPPGIAKKVARGGTLPPGIAKRYLPSDLDQRLRPRPAGVERIIVGNDVLLIEAATGLVYDIVRNALAGR
jgi:Ni/Co efflux regulator RcnB